MTSDVLRLGRRAFVRTAIAGLMAVTSALPPSAMGSEQNTPGAKIQLSREHIAAVNRRRRVVINFDTGFHITMKRRLQALKEKSGEGRIDGKEVESFVVQTFFNMFDRDPGIPVDSVWWCLGEGNCAFWRSEILKLAPEYQELSAAGIDPLRIFHEECKKRGMESFFSFRNNGSDNEYGPVQRIPLKEAHPDWLHHAPWEGPDDNGFWNFAIEGVRQMKVATLREVAENYDFDGIEIDYSRGPITLPIGHQWENRHHLTDYMRAVRSMTLEVEKKRGRPFLLAARIPENLEGCHYDGTDVETWVREQLVDILVLGNRSFEVDLAAFRRITAGSGIKLYPCIDEGHASDGYRHPPSEVFRGVFANWWHQGADGIQTFNFYYNLPVEGPRRRWQGRKPTWALLRQAYWEMTGPQVLQRKDKTFVVQRRGGGHGAEVVPDPAHWTTPRHMYFLTNMFSQLPAPLANDGRADTLLLVYVADDVAAESQNIEQITVRALLSDPEAKDLPASGRLDQFSMSSPAQPGSKRPNIPPAKGIENQIELRLNNILLSRPTVEQGWLVFEAQPTQFAVGKNLVGLRVNQRSPKARSEIVVELLEVHVDYSN